MDLLIKNARIEDNQPLQDVAIDQGKISEVADHIQKKADQEIDADGRVLVPGFVESHVHLDKALISDRRPNKSGTLQEAITVTAELKPTFTKEDVEERARKVLDMIIAHGVTAIRSHAEFDPAQG
ncbi:amidohydrolase family protein, partial [Tetragenococcus halophilus]